ncbi:MAG TPA: hypothetical protein VFQ79_16605 [Bryobacteraceae bacterium]|nr:hypothetical protein [Bryobacteraceae bacterium]
MASASAISPLDVAPPKRWRRFVPPWLRSLIWIDTADRYDAFLSYSWKSDSKVAPVVQSLIQRFLRPWYRLRAKTVFRDLSCLPAGSSLEAELFDRLDRSKHLIVLASTEAATSRGMETEAQYWFSRKRDGEVIIIISSGDAEGWEEIRECLIPPSLRMNLPSAPVWASIRQRRDRILANPADQRLRAELIEDLKQVFLRFYPDRDWGQLRGEERSQRRRVLGLLSCVSLLLMTLTAFSWFLRLEAVQQRSLAEHRQRIAVSRQLAAQATATIAGHFDLALLLSVESYRHEITVESYQSLLAGLEHEPRLAQLVRLPGTRISKPALDATGVVTVVTWDSNRGAAVWDVTAGRPVCQLPSTLDVRSGQVKLTPDARAFAHADSAGAVSIWDARMCRTVRPGWVADPEGVRTIAFSHDGSRLVTGGESGTLKIWNLNRQPPEGRVLANAAGLPITAATFSPDDRVVAFARGPATGVAYADLIEVRLVHLESGRSTKLKGPTGIVRVLAWDDTGGLLASGGCGENPTGINECVSGEIVVWDTRQEVNGHSLPDVAGDVHDLRFVPGATALFSAGCGEMERDGAGVCAGDISLWDLESVSHAATMSEVRRFIDSIAMNPNGQNFVTIDDEGVAQWWRITNQHPLIEPIESRVVEKGSGSSTRAGRRQSTFLSRSGKVRVTYMDGDIEVENSTTGRSARIRSTNSDLRVEGTAVSEDDRILVSLAQHVNGGETELRLWDVETGRPLSGPLTGHTREIVAAAFNKDGTVLVAGGCGQYATFSGCAGELVLWHVPSGLLLTRPIATGANVLDVRFDGARAIVEMERPGSEPMMATIDVDIASWAKRACARANRNLSADEWRRYLPDEPLRDTCALQAVTTAERP